MKSAFKWASLIDHTLHLSQHDGNRRIVQIWVLVLFWTICMLPYWHLQQWHRPWSGALAEVLFWKLSNTHRWLHRPLVVEMAYTLSLVSWMMHFAVGTKWSSVVLRSLPSMANATRLQVTEKRISSRESVIAPSAFLPNFTSKIAACEFLSSSTLDSHRSRTYPLETILAWTDRLLLLLEWHPTKASVLKQLFCVC